MRQAIGALREDITRDLAADLTLMPKLQHLDAEGLHVMADLIVKSVFATLPDIIDPPAQALPAHLTPQAKITQQLRFIFIGLKHWQGLGSTSNAVTPPSGNAWRWCSSCSNSCCSVNRCARVCRFAASG